TCKGGNARRILLPATRSDGNARCIFPTATCSGGNATCILPAATFVRPARCRMAEQESGCHQARRRSRAKLTPPPAPQYNPRPCGAVAQLGERLNGIQEVEGSTPFGSTIILSTRSSVASLVPDFLNTLAYSPGRGAEAFCRMRPEGVQ